MSYMPSVSHVEFSRQAKAPQPTWRALFRQRTTSAAERSTGTTLQTHRSPMLNAVKSFSSAKASHTQLQSAVALSLFRTGGKGNKEGPKALPKGVIRWSHATDHQPIEEQKLQLPKPSTGYMWIKREATPGRLWLDGDLRAHPNLILIACVYSFIRSSSKEGRS